MNQISVLPLLSIRRGISKDFLFLSGTKLKYTLSFWEIIICHFQEMFCFMRRSEDATLLLVLNQTSHFQSSFLGNPSCYFEEDLCGWEDDGQWTAVTHLQDAPARRLGSGEFDLELMRTNPGFWACPHPPLPRANASWFTRTTQAQARARVPFSCAGACVVPVHTWLMLALVLASYA